MFKEWFRKAQTLPGTPKTYHVIPAAKNPSSDKSVFRCKCVQHHTYYYICGAEYI
jgi:hypothetical protein